MKHAIAILTIALLATGPAAAQDTDKRAETAMTTRIQQAPNKWVVTNDWNGAAYQALRIELAAKPVASLTTNEATFICASAQFVTDPAQREAIAPALKAIADAAHPMTEHAASKYIQHFAKAGEVATYAPKLNGNAAAHTIKACANRLNLPAIWSNWCKANRAKGVSAQPYRRQWLEDFEAAAPADKIHMAKQEINALIKGRAEITTPEAEAWLRELRLRLMVAKEIQAE